MLDFAVSFVSCMCMTVGLRLCIRSCSSEILFLIPLILICSIVIWFWFCLGGGLGEGGSGGLGEGGDDCGGGIWVVGGVEGCVIVGGGDEVGDE